MPDRHSLARRVALPGGVLSRRGAGAWLAAVARLAVRVLGSPWFLGPLIALSTWPVRSLVPEFGDDGSFIIALHLADVRGMDFGRDLVYTYGPLGFLTFPRLIDPQHAVAAFAYVGAVHVALATGLLLAVRRMLPVVLAVVVVVLSLDALRLAVPDEITQPSLLALVVVAGVWALSGNVAATSRWWPAMVCAGGLLAGGHLLVKVNAGVVMVVMMVVIVVGVSPRGARLRWLGVLALTALVSLLAAWFVTGQSLAALPDYLRYSLEVVRGYSDSFSAEDGDRLWEYLLLPLVGVAVVVVAWLCSDGWPAARRWALGALLGVYLYGAFKQGFVRHTVNSPTFFVACLLAALAVSRRLPRRLPVLLVLAMLITASLATIRPSPGDLHDTGARIHALRAQIRQLRDSTAQIAQVRSGLRNVEAIPDDALRQLRGRRTHIFPNEAAVAFAYPEIKWDPIPAFQSLVAYTSALTRLDARRLASPQGPDRILRTAELSTTRDPAVWRELLCRFVPLYTGDRWQVLGRTADRCGRLRSLGRRRTEVGREVPVPAAGSDEAVFVAVHGLGPDLGERLRTVLWRAYTRELVVNRKVTQRLALDLAATPTLIRVPAAAGTAPPFSLGLAATTIRVDMATDGVLGPRKQLDRSIEIEFFGLPVRPPKPPAPAGRGTSGARG